MRSRRGNTSVAVLALLVTALLASAQVALAVFHKTASGGPLTVATATLPAPGKPTAAQVNCRFNKNPEIEVNWSATTSGYASGYAVERATVSVGPYTTVGSVPLGETSYTDQSAALASSTTYYYRVADVRGAWSAPSAATSIGTLSRFCLPF
jgi:hypothetical protein